VVVNKDYVKIQHVGDGVHLEVETLEFISVMQELLSGNTTEFHTVFVEWEFDWQRWFDADGLRENGHR